MRSRPNATIAEVARLAGVSTATAGRVLGGYGYSSEDKKRTVLAAAKSLGYRPNLLARGLITGSTGTIGVVAGDIQSPFYAAILRGVSDVADREGFGVLIVNSDEDVAREVRAVELLREKQVDGLIVSPCDTRGAAHLRDVAASGLPLVLIDREVEGLDVDTVGVDNVEAARSCVAGLIRAGHARIGLVGELEDGHWARIEDVIAEAASGPVATRGLYPSWQRLLGYLLAHREAGLAVDPALVLRVGRYSVDAAKRHAGLLLERDDPPSALFTTDGVMSAGTVAAIRGCRLRVPDDLSLCCFDDLDWMAFVEPGIDAVVQPRTAMGEAATRLLLDRVAGHDGPARPLTLATCYVSRGSVAPHGPRAARRRG